MPDQLYEVSNALNKAAGKIKSKPIFMSTGAGQRIANAMDNIQRYSLLFAQLEAATRQPGANDANWRKQVDAIIYAPMDDEAAQKLIALIELVDADAKYQG